MTDLELDAFEHSIRIQPDGKPRSMMTAVERDALRVIEALKEQRAKRSVHVVVKIADAPEVRDALQGASDMAHDLREQLTEAQIDLNQAEGEIEDLDKRIKELHSQREEARAKQQWIKMCDQKPLDKEETAYFVFHDGGVKVLFFNPHHQCWDDESGDDFFCHLDEVTHYMPYFWPARPNA